MTPSWMLARLQHETEAFHEDADGHRLSMLCAPTTVDQYRAWLSRIYGFESAVEAALLTTPGLEIILDVRARCQIRLLRADLVSLDILDPAVLPRHLRIIIRDVAEALGWVYVLERGSQLHGLVERNLRARMPATMRVAGSYLTMQERSIGTRWRELGDAMDGVGAKPRAAERIATAAKLAFRRQRDWFDGVMPERLRVA